MEKKYNMKRNDLVCHSHMTLYRECTGENVHVSMHIWTDSVCFCATKRPPAGRWGPPASWRSTRAMDWVDWLRTSADVWVLSGRSDVVMVWWAAVGFGCSALTLRFFANSQMMHLRTGPPAPQCSPTGALLHRYFPSDIFYNYARGHCEATQSCSRVVHSKSESVLGW